jgi:hypothetical protein
MAVSEHPRANPRVRPLERPASGQPPGRRPSSSRGTGTGTPPRHVPCPGNVARRRRGVGCTAVVPSHRTMRRSQGVPQGLTDVTKRRDSKVRGTLEAFEGAWQPFGCDAGPGAGVMLGSVSVRGFAIRVIASSTTAGSPSARSIWPPSAEAARGVVFRRRAVMLDPVRV